MKNKRFLYILIAIVLLLGFLYFRNSSGIGGESDDSLISSVISEIADDNSGSPPEAAADPASEQTAEEAHIDRDGVYDSKEDVALYIHTYGTLPSNFITKDEAMKAGWSGSGGDKLDKYCPGKCIGGDWFGNYEGKLPKAKGRTWAECDIGTLGAKNRGIKRIIFSNDGLIYYTEDHYETFELLYGEP